ncbi:MAG: hypothetical protein QXU99_06465 [Candidatus Bathyarchaeia archaeon]
MKSQQLTLLILVATAIGAFLFADKTLLKQNDVDGSWFGICVHALTMDDARLVNETGASWIRIDVSENFENAVQNARAYNLKVLGILDSWMFNKNTVFTLDDWQNNVTHYVSRYADYVDAWEIWNEPATPAYPLLNLNVKENLTEIVVCYLKMVQIASPIIRQYDPTAKIVLLGGLNLWSGGDENLLLDKEFSRQLSALNVGKYGDVISVHAYPWGSNIGSWLWEKYDESLAYYRGLFPTHEFWLTETGCPLEEAGEEGQVQYMCSATKHFSGKVERLFWYSLLDNIDDQGKSFGLLSKEAPRTAYYTLQKLAGTEK